MGSCEVREMILVRQGSLENRLSHELGLNSIGVTVDFWIANVATPLGRRYRSSIAKVATPPGARGWSAEG